MASGQRFVQRRKESRKERKEKKTNKQTNKQDKTRQDKEKDNMASCFLRSFIFATVGCCCFVGRPGQKPGLVTASEQRLGQQVVHLAVGGGVVAGLATSERRIAFRLEEPLATAIAVELRLGQQNTIVLPDC